MLAIVIVNNDLTVPSTNDPKFHQQVKKNVVYTHTHTHDEILLSHNNECNFAICSSMHVLGGHYVK